MAPTRGVSLRKNELPHAPEGAPATVVFEGRPLAAKVGEPLSVTLLAHGIDIASRSVKYHRPRGAFCMVGTCGQCWMRVDDVPNRAACTTPVRSGLTATRENAFPSADHDLFRAADYAFPDGLDHHKLGTTPLTPLNTIIGSTARQMAGLGTLSSQVPPPAPKVGQISADALVVGGGPAGLAAARALAQAGHGVLLVERRRALGGQILSGLFGDDAELAGLADRCLAALSPERSAAFTHTVALGAYPRADGLPEILLRRHYGTPEEQLWVARARTIVFATGGYEQALLFGNNDLPGHYGARALARLVVVRGVSVGARVAIVEDQRAVETADRLEQALTKLGHKVRRIRGHGERAERVMLANGSSRIKSLRLSRGEQAEEIKVDAVASALPVAPAFELPSQAGCAIRYSRQDGGFAVQTTDTATDRPGIFAAGELTGAKRAADAMKDGAIAGAAAARWLEETGR